MAPENESGRSDGPDLGQDRLLEQLVERAREIAATQARVRKLLRANRTVVEELDLPTVLRRIIEAAVDLVGAEYGAVGVFGDDGGFEQFIHVGMDERTVRLIGDLPQGRGLLGAMKNEERPVRLRTLSADPRSGGFPEGHPSMTSFLGVPIRARGATFGSLYLTEQVSGEFTADDEELVSALAATAGIAIANARLFEHSRHRERWTAASAQIAQDLLTREGPEALELIARRVLELASADLVTVILPASAVSDELVIEYAVGSDSDHVLAKKLPQRGSLVGRALSEGRAQLMADISDGSVVTYLPDDRYGPAMAIPLLTPSRSRGALSVVRKHGAPRFTEFDLEVVGSFAAQATLALELADGQRDRARLALFEDRERIARDLHDHVVQQLFAIGLTLQSVSVALGPNEQSERVQEQVNAIDATIRQIRTSIFALRARTDGESPPRLRSDVLRLAEEAAPGLNSSPRVSFRGPVDTVVPAEVYPDVLAVVREGLSNVSRHAKANTCEVALEATTYRLTVEIVDDGVGIRPGATYSGIANLRSRAYARGGSFDVENRHPHGTEITWSVPIREGER